MANKKTASKKKPAAAKKKKQEKKDYLKIHIIVFSIVTVVLALFMYINTDGNGIINIGITRFVCGLFGKTGYFLPVALGGCTIYLIKTKDIKKFWLKFTLTMLLMINVSAIVALGTNGDIQTAFWLGADDNVGGGVLGSCISVFLTGMVHIVISYIILIFTFLLLASLVTGVSFFKILGIGTKKAVVGAKTKYDELKENYEERKAQEEEAEQYIREFEEPMAQEPSDALDVAKSFSKDELKTKSNAKPEKEEAPEPFSDGIDEVFAEFKSTPGEQETFDEVKEKPKKKKSITEAEKTSYNEELDRAIEQPSVQYVYPPIKLLNQPKRASGDLREELRSTAQKLISILDDFGVKAKLLQVTQGPTVTRFEIQPETGVKLSKIVGLADDIALNLAVSTVLVAPVPGKAAVGIEIPNNKVSSVSIREMLDSDVFKDAKSKLTFALGKDIGGNVVVGDIAKMPHLLIAGATGAGKSVCINTMIMSILYKAKPEDVKLIMVDPKRVELGVYNGIPHLLIPVVTDPKKAAGALNWAVTEMMHRYDLFTETGVRQLDSYNKLMEKQGGEKIPKLVIIIDELADLMMVAAKEVEDYIVRLTQLARAAGIHLVIATQRPSVDVITGLIKANVPSRIALAVSSQVDSRTILDKGGAEKLLGKGDMLYHPAGARSAMRVQGAFVTDGEIETVVNYIKENVGVTHYSEDLEEEIERCSTGENGVTPDTEEEGDALLPDAISLAVELGKISTSMVQRRLGVGYSRAGRIIDQMEARGIISGANGSKPRDVLVSHADMPRAGNSYEYDEE